MIIALTGKLGSGKTTISNMFKDLGANVIDVDKLGHELLIKERVKEKLVQEFGSDVLDGKTISRTKLGEKVFRDIDNLKKLNQIIHPLLIQKIRERTRPGLNVIDAALYYELDLEKISDKTILVKCSEDKVLKRLNNMVLASRRKFQKDIKNPDYVVDNTGTLEDTKQQVLKIWGELDGGSLSGDI